MVFGMNTIIVYKWLLQSTSCAAIDFPAVPDLDYFDGAGCIIDGVNDSELTLANAITLLCSRKLFTPNWSRFGRKSSDSLNNALAILLLIKRLDLFPGGRLDEQPISGHVALGRGQKIRTKRFAPPCVGQMQRSLQHLLQVPSLPLH
jgi:hypothetical protein